jgi:hypothetical protein
MSRYWLGDEFMTNDYDLFKHMSDTHGLTLTGSEMHEIRISAGLLELEIENAKLIGLLKEVEFLAYQPEEVRDAINSLSNAASHRSQPGASVATTERTEPNEA